MFDFEKIKSELVDELKQNKKEINQLSQKYDNISDDKFVSILDTFGAVDMLASLSLFLLTLPGFISLTFYRLFF